MICGSDYRAHSKVRTCSKACGYKLRSAARLARRAEFIASGQVIGRYIDQAGYVRVLAPLKIRAREDVYAGGWLLEHRFVMEQQLGRPLTKTETVHHLNGDRADNQIENLELRVGRHGVGATHAHCATCTCFDH